MVKKLATKTCGPSLNPQGFSHTLLQGPKASEFEPFGEKVGVEGENGRVDGEIEMVADKVEKVGKGEAKSAKPIESEKKFSNHIEFVDYIPTHEIVTYRHLFAYGFYIV